jgi:hypothetical protein
MHAVWQLVPRQLVLGDAIDIAVGDFYLSCVTLPLLATMGVIFAAEALELSYADGAEKKENGLHPAMSAVYYDAVQSRGRRAQSLRYGGGRKLGGEW